MEFRLCLLGEGPSSPSRWCIIDCKCVSVWNCLLFSSWFYSFLYLSLLLFRLIHFDRSLGNIALLSNLCNQILLHKNWFFLQCLKCDYIYNLVLWIGLGFYFFSRRCDLVYHGFWFHTNRSTVSGRNCACIDIAR